MVVPHDQTMRVGTDTFRNAARTTRSALRRAWNWYANSAPAVRLLTGRRRTLPTANYVSAPRLEAAATESSSPDFELLAALLLGGAVTPTDALTIALFEADRGHDQR